MQVATTPSVPGQDMVSTGIPSAEVRTLWMGQLQQNWEEPYVSSLFESVAKPVTVKIMKYPGTSLGYAFIDFATHEDAKNVLNTFSNQRIPGTNQAFKLNWGAGNNRRSFGGPNEFSLFVGDLPQDVTDAMLHEAFVTQFPSCTSAKVVIDGYTGTSKGYGFVRFADKNQCDAAIATMNGMVIGGRQVRVSPATAPTRRQSAYQMAPMALPFQYGMQPFPGPGGDARSVANGYRNAPIASAGGMSPAWGHARGSSLQGSLLGADVGGAPLLVSARTSEESGSPEMSAISGMQLPEIASLNSSFSSVASSENTTVFVGNLDPAVSEMQLQQHFQAYGNIVQVKIPPNRGCGFVKFDSHDSAEKALTALNGTTLCNQRIRLDWGKASANRQQQAVLGGAVDPAMAGYAAFNPYYMNPWQAQTYYYRYQPQYVMPQQAVMSGARYPQDGFMQGMPMMAQGQLSTDVNQSAGLEDVSGLADYGTVNSAMVAQQQPGQSSLAWNGIVQ